MLKYMSTSCKPHKLAIAREIPKFKNFVSDDTVILHV